MKRQMMILAASALLLLGVGCNKSEPAKDVAPANKVIDAQNETVKAEAPKEESEDEPPKEESNPGEAKDEGAKANDEDHGLTSETIQTVVKEHTDVFRKCYEDQLDQNKDLAGTIMISWFIIADGSVTNVSLKNSTMKNEAVESCLIKEIGTLKFPAMREDDKVKVEYPFVFEAGKDPRNGDEEVKNTEAGGKG